MLVQYKLSSNARRRQFLEGFEPAERNMLEIDVKRLPRAAHEHFCRAGHVSSFGFDHKSCLVLEGEYDALTFEELIPELVTRARE